MDVVVSLPTGWTEAPKTPVVLQSGALVVAVGPWRGGSRASFVLNRELVGARTSLEQFSQDQLAILKHNMMSYCHIRDKSSKFGRYSGILREHIFKENPHDLAQLQFYFLRDGFAYVGTYTSAAADLASGRADAELILSTLR